jgi:hypothetical protein
MLDQTVVTLSAFDFPVFRFVAYFVAFSKSTAAMQGRDMDEHVRSAVVRSNKAKAFVAVENFTIPVGMLFPSW